MCVCACVCVTNCKTNAHTATTIHLLPPLHTSTPPSCLGVRFCPCAGGCWWVLVQFASGITGDERLRLASVRADNADDSVAPAVSQQHLAPAPSSSSSSSSSVRVLPHSMCALFPCFSFTERSRERERERGRERSREVERDRHGYTQTHKQTERETHADTHAHTPPPPPPPPLHYAAAAPRCARARVCARQ